MNLAVRFLLEVSALLAMGVLGWRAGEGWLGLALAVMIPVTAGVLWGTFAVPDDPSRSGSAPVPIPGTLRLLLEAAVFVFAVWAINDLGFAKSSWALGIAVASHYAISYDRVHWLLGRQQGR